MSEPVQLPEECRLPRSSAVVKLLRVSRVFGTAPVTLERQGDDIVVRVCRKYAVIACTLFLLVGETIIITSIMDPHIGFANNQLEHIDMQPSMIVMVKFLLINVVVAVGGFGGPGRMQRFLSYCARIQQMYATIENQMTWKSLEKPMKSILMAILSVHLVSVFFRGAEIISDIMLSQGNLIFHAVRVVMYVGTIVSSLIVIQIMITVVLMLCTLKAFNRSIVKLPDRIKCVGRTEDASSTIEVIRGSANLFAEIVDMCAEINAMEGCIMLLMLVVGTIRILMLAVHVASTITADWGYIKILVQFWYFIRLTMNLVILVEPCNRTHQELKKAQVLVSKVLCASSGAPEGVSRALVRFYEATESCGNVYTPMGVFEFSSSIYAALIGALTTLNFIFTA